MRSKADTRRALSHALADLEASLPAIELFHRKADEFAGSGFGSGDPGAERVSGGGGPSSPVERAAFAPDPARRALARVDELAERMHRDAEELRKVITFWTSDPDRDDAKPEPIPGCEVMRSVGVWESGELTYARGNLDRKMILSRWAKTFVIKYGRLPTRAEAELRAQGRRVIPKAA